MQFALKDIRANPFRHIERYPFRPDKIERLIESIGATGWWDNVVARAVNGGAEIAYGHHRLEALRRIFPPDHRVELVVRDLDDDQMLKIMARENMEEFGTSAAVEQETVRATIEAFAAGRIHLAPPDRQTNRSELRVAPHFHRARKADAVRESERIYTAQTIAEFIGWLKPSGNAQEKVYYAIEALEFIEDELLTDKDFAGLSTMQARAVVIETRKAREHREAVARAQEKEAEKAAARAREAETRREAAAKEEARQRAEAEAAAKRREAAEAERQRKAEEAAEAKRQRETERAATAEREAAAAEERRAKAAEEEKQRRAAAMAAEHRRRDEEQQRQAAAGQERAARREAEHQRAVGDETAAAVGREVSRRIKDGEGVKRAGEIAAGIEGRSAVSQLPPPNIEQFCGKLMAQIAKILDPDADIRAVRLVELIKFRDHLPNVLRRDAVETMLAVARRVQGYADQLQPPEERMSQRAPRLATSGAAS